MNQNEITVHIERRRRRSAFALRMLSAEARAEFARLVPALAKAETAGQDDPAEAAYGPTARPFVKLCDMRLSSLAA